MECSGMFIVKQIPSAVNTDTAPKCKSPPNNQQKMNEQRLAIVGNVNRRSSGKVDSWFLVHPIVLQ
jgi:hypothetical protein